MYLYSCLANTISMYIGVTYN